MRFYLAGLYTSNFHKGSTVYNFLDDAERAARDSVDRFLESYHYIGKGKSVERIRADGARIFCDSGAYSAMTKGVVMDIRRYGQFVLDNADIIDAASVLDAIGDAAQTWRNQRELEQLGVRTLPCFHYGEDVAALEWYLEHYDYVTLGGMVPISTPQLITWLDRLWSKYLTHPDGRPRVRVHGFGLTSLELCERYPWYSVDSSTWVQASAMGEVMLPGFGRICVAAGSHIVKEQGRHIDNLPSPQRDAIVEIITSMGFSVDRIRANYQSRWAYNCWAYKSYLDTLHEVDPRFVLPQPELF